MYIYGFRKIIEEADISPLNLIWFQNFGSSVVFRSAIPSVPFLKASKKIKKKPHNNFKERRGFIFSIEIKLRCLNEQD